MQKIDLETWDRKEHYLLFQRADFAQYNIGADLDISTFKTRIKNQGLSFTWSMAYAASAAMNKIENFRYRLMNDELALYDKVHPALAYSAPDLKYFKMIMVEFKGGLRDFVLEAQKKARNQKAYFPPELNGRADLVFMSSIPKISFTHLSHTISLNKNDAAPRLTWGKYYLRDSKLRLPFNVQAHHAFVDGDHMGAYFETLQQYLDNY